MLIHSDAKRKYEELVKRINSGDQKYIEEYLNNTCEACIIEYCPDSPVNFPSYEVVSKLDKQLISRIYACSGEILQALLYTTYSGNNFESISQEIDYIIDKLPANKSIRFLLSLPIIRNDNYDIVLLKVMISKPDVLDSHINDALEKDNIKLLELCIEAGSRRAKLDKRSFINSGSFPLLHRAAAANKSNCVKMLLEFGADPIIKDSTGKRAFEYTSFQSILILLIGHNKNTLYKTINKALEEDNPGLFKVYLKVAMILRNCDIYSLLNGSKLYLLHRAAQSGSITCVKLLLELGANPMLKDGNGKSATEVATSYVQQYFTRVTNNALNIVYNEAVNKDNANLLYKYLEGKTRFFNNNMKSILNIIEFPIIHILVSLDKLNCVQLLLKLGANPMLKDGNGKTAMEYVTSPAMQQLFIEANQDILINSFEDRVDGCTSSLQIQSSMNYYIPNSENFSVNAVGLNHRNTASFQESIKQQRQTNTWWASRAII